MRRRFFASRSVAVTCAGFETLIRTAIVVVFFSSIRFEPATEKTSRVCGAAVPRETTRSIGSTRARTGVVGRLDDGARRHGRARFGDAADVKPAAPSAAVASSRDLPARTGTARSGAVCG